MSKYKVSDVVLIYEGNKAFPDGTVAQVIDYDPHDDSYAIADLRDIGIAGGDIGKILNRGLQWAKPEEMRKLTFKKESLWQRIFNVFR